MFLLFALVFLNWLDTPLSIMLHWGIDGLCKLTWFPVSYFGM
jgi:hypothetical protein